MSTTIIRFYPRRYRHIHAQQQINSLGKASGCFLCHIHGINETSFQQNYPVRLCTECGLLNAHRPMVIALHFYPETCFGNTPRWPMRLWWTHLTWLLYSYFLQGFYWTKSIHLPGCSMVRIHFLLTSTQARKLLEAPRVPSTCYYIILRLHSPLLVSQSFILSSNAVCLQFILFTRAG